MTVQLGDQLLTCEDCDTQFLFTVAEQVFYAERSLRRPTRCAPCRGRRRAERNAEMLAAYDSLAEASVWHEPATAFGGHRVPGGTTRRPRGNGGPRVTYRTICAACGRATEVPFEPRGGRPVYCRECFNQRRGR